jgi:hypothetical protein
MGETLKGLVVIPAKAGIQKQLTHTLYLFFLDARFRGHDELVNHRKPDPNPRRGLLSIA